VQIPETYSVCTVNEYIGIELIAPSGAIFLSC
jgi:hypothetical protein